MRIYKYSFIAVLALGSLLLGSNFSSAQDAKEGKKKGATTQERVDRLSERLSLTAEQKPKVTALFEEERKQISELRNNSNLSADEKREKGRTLREDFNKKMKAILTPEQWTKFEKGRQELRQRRGNGETKKES
jgi:Spy/CpxP family protein refolding chaperone